MGKKILLTGGAGFIGSHTAVELINAGYETVIADDLSNSRESVIDAIEKITGKRPTFYQINVADNKALEKVFAENKIDAVVHFAGFKAVGESCHVPVKYYRNNLDTTLSLLETMAKFDCHTIIFSSSATVYGDGNQVPYTEEMPTGNCSNPYGWTKYVIEQILKDAASADAKLSAVCLRYFNPVGAHESGLIGERPNGIPNNLMPYITQTAAGKLKELSVFGNDYDTPDGTGVRDYIHVVDLAKGHVAAVKYALDHTGWEPINLGTGKGTSVLEMVNTFQEVNGVTVPHKIAPRRSGDIAWSYASTDKAEKILGWKANLTVGDMCKDSWEWEKKQ